MLNKYQHFTINRRFRSALMSESVLDCSAGRWPQQTRLYCSSHGASLSRSEGTVYLSCHSSNSFARETSMQSSPDLLRRPRSAPDHPANSAGIRCVPPGLGIRPPRHQRRHQVRTSGPRYPTTSAPAPASGAYLRASAPTTPSPAPASGAYLRASVSDHPGTSAGIRCVPPGLGIRPSRHQRRHQVRTSGPRYPTSPSPAPASGAYLRASVSEHPGTSAGIRCVPPGPGIPPTRHQRRHQVRMYVHTYLRAPS